MVRVAVVGAAILGITIGGWLIYTNRLGIGSVLVEKFPPSQNILQVGSVRVVAWNKEYTARLANREIFLQILQDSGLFAKSGITFPFHDGTRISGVRLEIIARQRWLERMNFSDRPIRKHFDGTDSPVLLWTMDVTTYPGDLVFEIVLDDRVIATRPWSDSDLSQHVSTLVLAEIKSAIQYRLTDGNKAVWSKIETKLGKSKGKPSTIIVLERIVTHE